jgi:hypothetical protein
MSDALLPSYSPDAQADSDQVDLLVAPADRGEYERYESNDQENRAYAHGRIIHEPSAIFDCGHSFVTESETARLRIQIASGSRTDSRGFVVPLPNAFNGVLDAMNTGQPVATWSKAMAQLPTFGSR